MSFSVHIITPPGVLAICGEVGCSWRGPVRAMNQQAQNDADEHIRAHYDRWEEYNEQIEAWKPGDPIVEYDSQVDEPSFPDLTNPQQPAVCGVDHPDSGWGPHHS